MLLLSCSETKLDALAAVQLQQTIVGQQVSVNTALVMCGISKVFVGQLIETGKPSYPAAQNRNYLRFVVGAVSRTRRPTNVMSSQFC